MESITAIVPARGGSRRLKNKNVVPFHGTTLLEHKIEQLKAVPEIDQIVVSSDCDAILALAEVHGVKAHKRPAAYCDEISKSFGEVVHYITSQVTGEHIVWATCTSPLVSPTLYSAAIRKYWKVLTEGYDSLTTVSVMKEYIWDQNGPLNYKPGLQHVPSKQLPEWYVVTNGISIISRYKAIEQCYVYGRTPYPFVIDKIFSVDIDDELDLKQAEAWLQYLLQMEQSKS